MTNLSFIYSELILAFSIMLLLIIGVFKKKSSSLVYYLSILTLLIIFIFTLSLFEKNSISLFLNSYKIDYLSTFMKVLLYLSGIFVMLSSSKYLILNQIFKIEYPILLLSSILGMSIMISSNDLIVFYMGLELQSLALYVLASFKRENPLSAESGLKYFVLSALSSGLLLYGCSLIYGYAGSTNFDIISSNINSVNYGLTLGIVFILVGLAFKISAVPFHMWTPDVYEGAPTSITSYFAVVPKVAGLALLIKFMFVPFSNILLEWQTIIIFISIASMILGAVAAMIQKNFKRLLAYSSIGHIGYALAGVATGAISGYQSAIVYISIYVIMNIGAFSCLYLLKKDGQYKENISDLSGISKKHPLLAISLLIILFSLAGVPPLGGFFAKFYVFVAVLEKEMYALAIIGLITTVMSAFYYLKIIKTIYFDDSVITFEQTKNRTAQASVLVSCTILITFFLYPSILNNLVNTLFVS